MTLSGSRTRSSSGVFSPANSPPLYGGKPTEVSPRSIIRDRSATWLQMRVAGAEKASPSDTRRPTSCLSGRSA